MARCRARLVSAISSSVWRRWSIAKEMERPTASRMNGRAEASTSQLRCVEKRRDRRSSRSASGRSSVEAIVGLLRQPTPPGACSRRLVTVAAPAEARQRPRRPRNSTAALQQTRHLRQADLQPSSATRSGSRRPSGLPPLRPPDRPAAAPRPRSSRTGRRACYRTTAQRRQCHSRFTGIAIAEDQQAGGMHPFGKDLAADDRRWRQLQERVQRRQDGFVSGGHGRSVDPTIR
jgi:hypothetical protein